MTSYIELMCLETFDERINYLKLSGVVGAETFGHLRYINQDFYKSKEWRRIRRNVIIRDMGRDLGMLNDDYEIHDMIIVHHIIPITVDDILQGNPIVYDLDNLICTSKNTHDYIHYGLIRYKQEVVTRTRNDQVPWAQ